MKIKLYLTSLLVFLAGAIYGEDGGRGTSLFRVLPSEDKLPEVFKFKEIVGGEVLRFGIRTNPMVLTDEKIIEEFSGKIFSKKSKKWDITSVLFCVYEVESEIGVFAFEFQTNDGATEAVSRLPENSEESVKFRRANVVIWIWRDEGVPRKDFQILVGLIK